MAEKLNKNLVSPAVQLEQKVRDLEEQRAVEQAMGAPESVGIEDAVNAARSVGPRPTILNVNTGEWEEVMPSQGRLRGVPIGPPNPAVLNRMWRGETRPLMQPETLT